MAMGKVKLMIGAVVAVLLVAGGVGFWLFSGNETAEATSANDYNGSGVAAAGTPLAAYYVVLPQPFIFNVTGDTRDRVVQIKVQLMVRGDNNEALAKRHSPLIESTLLQSFGAATVEQLRSPNGRDQLRQQALDAVRATMIKVSGVPAVERVLFTGFVMQ